MKTIGMEWERFALALGLDKASAIQRSEMRRAFYAGAMVMLGAAVQAARESGDDDEAGARMMQALSEEGKQFARDLLAGKG